MGSSVNIINRETERHCLWLDNANTLLRPFKGSWCGLQPIRTWLDERLWPHPEPAALPSHDNVDNLALGGKHPCASVLVTNASGKLPNLNVSTQSPFKSHFRTMPPQSLPLNETNA